MPSGMPDSSPSAGSKNGGGLKNDDSRQKGSTPDAKATFKDVGVEPNEGAPSLPDQTGHLE